MLLLQNSREQLDFKNGRHNLESFEKILNWEYEEEELIVKMNCPIIFLENYDLELIYTKGALEEISIKNPEETILNFRHTYEDLESIENKDGAMVKIKLDLNFNLKIFLDSIYQNIHRFAENNSIQGLAKTIQKSDEDYLLYNVYIDGENCTDIYKDEILRIQNESFLDDPNYLVVHHLDNYLDFVLLRYRTTIAQCFDPIKKNINDRFALNSFDELPNSRKKIEIKESSLGELLFSKSIFESIEGIGVQQRTLLQQIENIDDLVQEKFKQLDFISASRGSQKRVLQNFSDNEIDKIIVDYHGYEYKNLPFLKEVFEILKIEGNLEIERYQNSVSIVFLKTKKGKIALADVGFGFSQIIPIILKIIMTTGTLIIEEPEANLHPALQSKLANILILAAREFPCKNFILETHSEYLIRKLQYLTAKKEISPKDSVIYYFNADEYVSPQEPKVKKIEITETGNLTENFGPGFYDEATRLQFDLMKINKEKKN